MDKKKNKRKITLILDFEKDKLSKSDNIRELEYSLLEILKEAINKDKLIIRETTVLNSEEIKFETIIIN